MKTTPTKAVIIVGKIASENGDGTPGRTILIDAEGGLWEKGADGLLHPPRMVFDDYWRELKKSTDAACPFTFRYP